jgi:hypothetical protein
MICESRIAGEDPADFRRDMEERVLLVRLKPVPALASLHRRGH